MNKFKILTVVGTRPELIRLSRVINVFDKRFEHIFVHTNQNYDYNLKDIFFNDLEIRKPNYTIRHNNLDLYSIISENFIEIEKIINKEKPDGFVVLGDTNSSLTAYVAKRNKIPIFHLEAGNRCFDENVPEEINRKIIDHISDVNIVYSSFAQRNLINEGIKNNNIINLGSPLYEVINYYKKKILINKVLKKYKVKKNNFFLISFHREENLLKKNNLNNFFLIINYLSDEFNLPILISTHPRTKKYVISKNIKKKSKIFFLEPFSYKDYISLQLTAKVTISDSGSLTEETSILNFKSICLRDNFERQEGYSSSSILISQPNLKSFKKILDFELKSVKKIDKSFQEYNKEDFSEHLARIVVSKIDYINKYTWHKNT